MIGRTGVWRRALAAALVLAAPAAAAGPGDGEPIWPGDSPYASVPAPRARQLPASLPQQVGPDRPQADDASDFWRRPLETVPPEPAPGRPAEAGTEAAPGPEGGPLLRLPVDPPPGFAGPSGVLPREVQDDD